MDSEHVILGVISFTPCSGYDMKAEFEKGGAGMLSALSFGSIYPRLKQLEQNGLIEVQQAESEGRRRKVYELTAQGWQDLAQWLEQPSDSPPPMRDELLLKMIFWGPAGQERTTLLEHLQARRREIQQMLHELRAWQKNGRSFIDEYAELVFSYGESRLEAELAWLAKAIPQLEGPERPPLQDPNDLASTQKARRTRALEHQSNEASTPSEQSQE
ncbi:hypothetical protein KSC_089220 [Ktedonobacter sp. SOSP1-52]|uniref:PadR family transcriptional regulator n=1 Tax=Ktedonobacter sp. SOSP1-52 TaxID=2778366 RepID=UPI0019163462|nr:PadR family transcriptional regulator [Ktedonobacter sp. SOSP1-52]GHO70030.1 hypothetical protein KSC_089220 [Ktedonobacter sp. SOSP1-52]